MSPAHTRARVPLNLGQVNRVCHRLRVSGAQRKFARNKGSRFLPHGYRYVNNQAFAGKFPVQFRHPTRRRLPFVQRSRSSVMARKNAQAKFNFSTTIILAV